MPTPLTPHFTREELECPCCGEMPFSEAALQVLEDLREAYGKPMWITSGYRCPIYNVRVSSSGENGPHTRTDGDNITVDVGVYGADCRFLTFLAIQQGWTGIGWNQKGLHCDRFVHLDRLPDCGTRPGAWTY